MQPKVRKDINILNFCKEPISLESFECHAGIINRTGYITSNRKYNSINHHLQQLQYYHSKTKGTTLQPRQFITPYSSIMSVRNFVRETTEVND